METQVYQEDNVGNKGLAWAITLISLVACILLLMFKPEWFWVTLPFLFTYMTKALGMM